MATALRVADHLGTIGARTGLGRDAYKVTPGLYATGTPGPDAPVIVTANYKLTFDCVRVALNTIDAWLLVVDTRGINVWCAAGKGTFSAPEVVYQLRRARLSEIVNHRQIILPQLAAPGVKSQQIAEDCSFTVVFGPVRAQDLADFINGTIDDEERMRSVTFSLTERLVLIPVELRLLSTQLIALLLCAFILSGFGPGFFTVATAVQRGWQFALATSLAVLAGTVITPVLLPWLPGRRFWLKGLLAAMLVIPLLFIAPSVTLAAPATLALVLWILAQGSYTAMNFTGSTPYTSLNGVEAEMRTGLVVQLILGIAAILLWLGAPWFSRGL